MTENIDSAMSSSGNGPDRTDPESGGLPELGKRVGTGAGIAAAKATNLAQSAQDYAGKVSDAATQARDFVNDKVTLVSDKLKELGNRDLGELAENAKEFARKNPGQALLISAAAGLLLGLLVRGRR